MGTKGQGSDYLYPSSGRWWWTPSLSVDF
jgi:hypothetical protein